MLMASGANFGFRRTVPHMFGVSLGFVFMVFLVGVGLMQAFDSIPWSRNALKVASVGYLVWLAWKIATSAPRAHGADGAGAVGKPMTFLQAAAFQWVNPKAWAMALTAVSVYAPSASISSTLLVAGIFGAVNLPSVSSWSILGQQMRRLLSEPWRLRAFNITMAVMLVGSLYPVLS